VAELGRFAILVALAAAAWAAAAAVYGARTGRLDAVRSAVGGLRAAAIALTVSAAALFSAFLTRDFSIEYVAEHSSRGLSLFYTVGAFWAGQAGSLLLWAWMLALYAVVIVRYGKRATPALLPYVTAVLGAVVAFFSLLLVVAANPFDGVPITPPDGVGLNPMLLNYGQWIHPLAIYLGYVGFTVPFAFCVAALATGRLDDSWIRTVRKWTLWSWVFLTAGIIFGARWAYVELGWGGYWAWDPVENASLLPWLTATAYLHSVMVQERKGMLRVWNASLAVGTFALSIFGTFLTRSGVVSSVHSFSQSNVGKYLLAAVFTVCIGGGALIVKRLPQLRSGALIESAVSREASFLVNNLLLVAMTFAVLWGTLYPILAEAVRGSKVTVGPPFFEQVVTPMAVVLIAVLGVCPMLGWRKTSGGRFWRSFVAPFSASLIGFGVLFVVLRGRHLGAVVVLSLGLFVGATTLTEVCKSASARRSATGERRLGAVGRLFARNPRRYGGYLIHIGIVVMLAGITLHTAFKSEYRAKLNVGDTTAAGRYHIELAEITVEESALKTATVVRLRARDGGGKLLGELRTEQAVFVNRQDPYTEVGILSSPREDVYVILERGDPDAQTAAIRVLVNPGVFWIWVGGVLLIFGTVVVASWPEGAKRTRAKEVVGEKTPVAAGLVQ